MSDAPVRLTHRAGWIVRGLDTIAYALAVLSIFPAGGSLLTWGLVLSGWGTRRPNMFMTWRRSIFELFRSNTWAWFLGYAAASALLAGIAFAISRPRRSTSRLAAASVRLAILGLALAAMMGALIGGLAAYRWWW